MHCQWFVGCNVRELQGAACPTMLVCSCSQPKCSMMKPGQAMEKSCWHRLALVGTQKKVLAPKDHNALMIESW